MGHLSQIMSFLLGPTYTQDNSWKKFETRSVHSLLFSPSSFSATWKIWQALNSEKGACTCTVLKTPIYILPCLFYYSVSLVYLIWILEYFINSHMHGNVFVCFVSNVVFQYYLHKHLFKISNPPHSFQTLSASFSLTSALFSSLFI